MHFIEVKIPKEIRQYKESIFFGLSARQFFCSVIAILIAAGVYLLLGKVIGKESASWLCIVLAAPAATNSEFIDILVAYLRYGAYERKKTSVNGILRSQKRTASARFCEPGGSINK